MMNSAIRRLTRSRLAGIVSRYTAGSVIAAVVSEATLLLLLGLHVTGPTGATVAAWVAGAITNYGLNRWAWGKRGRPRLWREFVPYWITALVSLGVSIWSTDLAHSAAPALFADRTLQVAFVGFVFLVTYAVLFVGKFLLFHYVLFADRDTSGRPRRSRDQVPNTTRA
ncbi:MAG: hypothetical protein GEV11_20480 [Streptosporangiales bacterium]|nr:hypothetical protein [Streptosporangiales bacterium]